MKTADGSIKDSDGKVIFFSFDRFMSDIVQGNCCFVCGVGPAEAAFNDEHVLPDWLLRKYRLHDKSVTLPNGTQFRYGGFTVPCCARCNARTSAAVTRQSIARIRKRRIHAGSLKLGNVCLANIPRMKKIPQTHSYQGNCGLMICPLSCEYELRLQMF